MAGRVTRAGTKPDESRRTAVGAIERPATFLIWRRYRWSSSGSGRLGGRFPHDVHRDPHVRDAGVLERRSSERPQSSRTNATKRNGSSCEYGASVIETSRSGVRTNPRLA